MLIKEYADEAKFTVDLTAKTAVTAAPTAVTDGVALPSAKGSTSNIRTGLRVQIATEFTRASGDGTCTIWVYGWSTKLATWYRLEALTQMAETAADMNHCVQIEVGSAFSRLATRVAEISGTTATVVATRIGWS